jgi:hypothetical protein
MIAANLVDEFHAFVHASASNISAASFTCTIGEAERRRPVRRSLASRRKLL